MCPEPSRTSASPAHVLQHLLLALRRRHNTNVCLKLRHTDQSLFILMLCLFVQDRYPRTYNRSLRALTKLKELYRWYIHHTEKNRCIEQFHNCLRGLLLPDLLMPIS
ncbi:unnamed protein product [Ectocarpus fasciculatus]